MQRLLSAVASFAFALSLAATGSAQSMSTAAPAKSMATTAPAKSMATAKPAMSMGKATPAALTCPKGQTAVKGYTKKDGTKVAPYCRKSS